MKSLLIPATRRMLALVGIAMLMALPGFARQSNWAVDAEHSTAWIFLGNNSDFQNIGVARVAGNAEYDSADPVESALALSANLPNGASITFKSKRSQLRADGSLYITGEMTLSRIEPDAQYNPGEDYSGPIYGEARVRTVTREVAVVLPPMDNPGSEMEISTQVLFGRESFPELFAAVEHAAWQPVIQDAACATPPAGEDYRGAKCSGTLIAPAYQIAAIRTGEDYRGDESPAASGNLMEFVFKLQLSRENLG